jgi:hypothetical protein
MLSAIAAAEMANAIKSGNNNVPVNMGPASSATEAYKNLFETAAATNQSNLPLEKPAYNSGPIPAPDKLLYKCDFCDYTTTYLYSKRRHEKLVHGRQQEKKKATKPPTLKSAVVKPLLKPEDTMSPPLKSIVKTQPSPKNSKKRKSPAVEKPVENKKKEIDNETQTVQEEMPKKTSVECQEKPVADLRYVKLEDGGKMVFYANEVFIRIGPGL